MSTRMYFLYNSSVKCKSYPLMYPESYFLVSENLLVCEYDLPVCKNQFQLIVPAIIFTYLDFYSKCMVKYPQKYQVQCAHVSTNFVSKKDESC